MSNTQSLIAEVKSDLSKYADAHLLDEDSMYRDIVLGLKRFGNDLMQVFEYVVKVEEGTGKLPDNFQTLYFAYLCNPVGYKPVVEEYHHLQDSLFYTERHVRTKEWNECTNCCSNVTETTIKEDLYFREKKVAEYYYGQPQLLRLGKAFNKTSCHSQCRNKLVRDNPNEIIIVGTTLQANFTEGHIYLQYYGLPQDENGMVDIPETFNGHLEMYLEYYVKRRAAERLIGNNDAVGLSTLYSVYAQQEAIALPNASNEAKMSRLGPKIFARLNRLNKLEGSQYHSALTRR
jgi:hypothetical protein